MRSASYSRRKRGRQARHRKSRSRLWLLPQILLLALAFAAVVLIGAALCGLLMILVLEGRLG